MSVFTFHLNDAVVSKLFNTASEITVLECLEITAVNMFVYVAAVLCCIAIELTTTTFIQYLRAMCALQSRCCFHSLHVCPCLALCTSTVNCSSQIDVSRYDYVRW